MTTKQATRQKIAYLQDRLEKEANVERRRHLEYWIGSLVMELEELED